MPRKTNNSRKYPLATKQPCHIDSLRKQEALERQEEYNKLSTQQKIDLLDSRLGIGKGATRQRQKLLAQLNKSAPQQQ